MKNHCPVKDEFVIDFLLFLNSSFPTAPFISKSSRLFMYNYGKSIMILYPINPATASTKLPFDKLDAIFINSANTIVEIAKNPKRKAETGKLNSSECTTTYFIMYNPSLAEGRHTK